MAKNPIKLAEDEIEKLNDFDVDFEDDTLEEGEEGYEIHDLSLSENLNTHNKTKSNLCGNILRLESGFSKVSLQTIPDMAVDEFGLVHSGFIFGSAEFAAVSAVNEENVVVIGSRVKFFAPAKVGDLVEFEAKAKFEDSRKREIKVIGKINEIKVFEGVFQAVVLENHILKTRLKDLA
ncbi:MAG: PaaI family thioesterase [Sulfurospirillaceae bacterium]|nr:PaaI family thioesterase [Sulfurospirillaceae bacterium]MDD3463493.1 PaaI family thioesterase [Sulfurospirillaceae bacterium]